MSNIVKCFNRRVPYAVRLLLIAMVGLFIYGSLNSALASVVKYYGGAPDCSWKRTLMFGFDLMRFNKSLAINKIMVSLKAADQTFDIQQFSTGGRDFWIKRTGKEMNGKALLTYLLSEHAW